ncbi:acetyl-CoA carboxylase, carboxyltransferase subunit beta [Blautia sp. Sow4_E7]|uniref:acetyl-CoA carboxylase, carboxyltransferase subunit beta n=1 Tax=Blautia sp. Sow4_E7 TaxID=3438749 RepID=UPI003F9054A8
MKLRYAFKRTIANRSANAEKEIRPEVPDGMLKKCNACKAAVFVDEVKKNAYICPHCGNYFRVHARRRIEMLADEGTFEEWDPVMSVSNPLSYKGYEEKVKKLQEKTGLDEAIVTGKAEIGGVPVALGVCDSRFLMASMGENVGEKIARAVEKATEKRLPVVLFACSGGARMQEGIVSLMQMAKTSAALKRHSDAGLLYISVLTNPTTGGVTASFAMLGDIILAEPNALIGFAGPRVIEQTIRQMLPKGFQRSEFLLEHGFIDQIVERKDMKETLAKILKMHCGSGLNERRKKAEKKLGSVVGTTQNDTDDKECNVEKSAWDHVSLARSKERPTGKDYLPWLFDYFTEFHGDRLFGDDPALIGGIAYFAGMPVTVLVQEKGNGTRENIAHNFGMVSPEGYRKSLRLMKQAEKFHRPVICLVDTPGAFCGLEAEERGQGEAIARNLFELSGLKVPILSIVIGEGGSGGALALAAGDEVWMMENAIYSILSPEGFASILWKDSSKAKEAAEVMKLTAADLKELRIIEQMIPEKEPLTRENMADTMELLKSRISIFLEDYSTFDLEKLLNKRYNRFRNL